MGTYLSVILMLLRAFRSCPNRQEPLRDAKHTPAFCCGFCGVKLTPADTGITTDTVCNISSTCVVLALVAGRKDCQPRPNSQPTDASIVTAASQSATLLSMTVNIASNMHFNALRSLTQPCLTAYCIQCNYPMMQALYQALQISVSLGKCI